MTVSTHRAAPTPTPIPREAWLSLIAAACGIFVVMLDGTVVSVANPTIAADLQASPPQIQWVTNLYLLVLAGLTIPMGTLADRFGRKRMFLLGVGGFSLASLLCGLSPFPGMLIGARALQAVFGAMVGPGAMGVLRAAFPEDRLPRAMGVFGSIMAIAAGAGPIIGGLLVEYASWPWVFFINLPFGVLGVALGAKIITESTQRVKQPIDVPGAVTLTCAMVALVYGITNAQTDGWDSAKTLGFLVAGLALLAVFGVLESRVSAPMVPLSLFRDRSFSIGVLLMIIVMFSMFGLIYFLTFFYQGPLGYSALMTGVGLLPLSVTQLVASPISGWMTEKAGVRWSLVTGAALIAVGLLLMQRVGADSSIWDLVPTFVIGGFGIGFMLVAAIQAIVGNAPVDKAGVASGLQQSMNQLGGAIGTSVLSVVVASVVTSTFADRLRDAFGGHGGRAVELVGSDSRIRKAVELGFSPQARQAVEHSATSAGVPAKRAGGFADTVATVAHETFIQGLHTVYWLGTAVAVAAGLLALLVRNKPANPGNER